MDNPEPTFGLLVTTVEGAEKRAYLLDQVMWSQKHHDGWWQGPVQHFHQQW